MENINSIKQCISVEEKKKRFWVSFINVFIWLIFIGFIAATYGVILLFVAFTWFINFIFSEYNVRKLQALGTTATKEQFPEIWDALTTVCDKFGVKTYPKVIIVSESAVNAFAMKFARKKVIILLSKTLEGVIDNPEELRFFIGHELAHILIDFGGRGLFEFYKPASYKAAREMTCDNCGCASAGSLDGAKDSLKRLGVGNRLIDRLNDDFLSSEAKYIYSGFTGWLLKQYMAYPPLGKRLDNVTKFVETNSQ